MHAFRVLKHPHARPHLLLVSGGGGKALEHVRMLVGDVEHTRAAFKDLRQLGRVHQALHSAVGDERRGRQGADRRFEALERSRSSGGPDRHRRRLARGRQDDVERPGAELLQGQLGELDIERPRLGLRQDSAGLLGDDLAAGKDFGEQVDPFALDPVGDHGGIVECAK